MIRYRIGAVTFGGLFLAFSTSFLLPVQPEGSLIAISARSVGPMQKGYGIIVTLTNLDSKEIFESKPLGPISPHSIIIDLPAGKYAVSKVQVPVGSLTYVNQSESLGEFFGQLEVEPGQNYYLGNFAGTRVIGRQNVLSLKIENQEIPQDLIRKLNKRNYNVSSSDFIKTYPYTENELMVY